MEPRLFPLYPKPSYPKKRKPGHPQGRPGFGAGKGSRTLLLSLGSLRSTDELYLHFLFSVTIVARSPAKCKGEVLPEVRPRGFPAWALCHPRFYPLYRDNSASIRWSQPARGRCLFYRLILLFRRVVQSSRVFWRVAVTASGSRSTTAWACAR